MDKPGGRATLNRAMPVVEDQAVSKGTPRRSRFPSLKSSWRVHVERPAIPAVSVLGSCLLFYVIGSLAGGSGRPETLARLFALAPLDSYGDLSVIADRTWLLPMTIVARAALVTAVVAMVSSVAFRLKNVAKVAVSNLAATASIFIFVATGWLYLTKKSEAVLEGEATPILPALLLLQVLGYVAVCVFFSPLICRAALGQRIRPSMLDPGVWLLCAASAWIWFFAAKRLEQMAVSAPTIAFAMALVLLLGQSVLLGAVAIRTNRRKFVT
jgi:hypothetical protein